VSDGTEIGPTDLLQKGEGSGGGHETMRFGVGEVNRIGNPAIMEE